MGQQLRRKKAKIIFVCILFVTTNFITGSDSQTGVNPWGDDLIELSLNDAVLISLL